MEVCDPRRIIVVVNLVLPGYVTGLCQGWGMNAGIAGTIASVVNTLLAVMRQLSAAQVLGHAEERRQEGGRQVSLH